MAGNAIVSLAQLCYAPCFTAGYWLTARGMCVFLQGAFQDLWEKSVWLLLLLNFVYLPD